jgi:hypothetical protein
MFTIYDLAILAIVLLLCKYLLHIIYKVINLTIYIIYPICIYYYRYEVKSYLETIKEFIIYYFETNLE